MGDLVAFLKARYDDQAADHWQTGDHCMRCGEDWPCYPVRDIEAKRRIIEIHKLEVTKDPARFNQLTGEQLPDVYEVNCAVCDWATDDPTSGCETLRLLALPYAGHKDYREERRP